MSGVTSVSDDEETRHTCKRETSMRLSRRSVSGGDATQITEQVHQTDQAINIYVQAKSMEEEEKERSREEEAERRGEGAGKTHEEEKE